MICLLAIIQFKPHYRVNYDSKKGLTKNDIEKWRKKIVAIDCLCDPVKRLFSDFLHVRATHEKKNNKPNRFDLFFFYISYFFTSQFLGADSKLFPFANMTFEDMVNKYLPHFYQLDNKNVVKHMFRVGFYADIVNAERKVCSHL